MPDDDELERRVRKLAIEHAETRWLALRLDDDVKEVREVQRAHTSRFDAIDNVLQDHSRLLQEHARLLQEHSARFDSLDGQLRSLTQLVGQVLQRLPDEQQG